MFLFYLIILLGFLCQPCQSGLATFWMWMFPCVYFIWRFVSPPDDHQYRHIYMADKLSRCTYSHMAGPRYHLTLSAAPDAGLVSTGFSYLGRLRPILFLWLMSPYCSERQQLYKMFRFLMILFILQCLVVFCQKFNIAGINKWYTPRFRITDVFVREAYLTGRRTIGSIGNPNSVGTFMSLMAMLGYSVYVFGKSYRRWIGLVSAVAALIVCIFFATTRQGTLAIILGCIVLSVIAFFLGKFGRLTFALLMVLLASPLLMYYLAQDYDLFERFALLRGEVGITDVGSMKSRLQLWPEFFREYGLWVFIGKGIAGFYAAITWDSGGLMLIVGGGIPLAMFYLWWLVHRRGLLQGTAMKMDPVLTGFMLAGPATSFVVLITNIVNNTYAMTKISIWIGMFYILSLAAAFHLQCAAFDLPDGEEDMTNFYGDD